MKKFVALSLCILWPWTTFAAEGGTTPGASPSEVTSQDPAPAKPDAANTEPAKAEETKAPAAKPAAAKPAPKAPAKKAEAAKPAAEKPKEIKVTKEEFITRAEKSKNPKVAAALKKYKGVKVGDAAAKDAAFKELVGAMGGKFAEGTAATAPRPSVKPTAAGKPPVVDPQPLEPEGPPAGPNAAPHEHPVATGGGAKAPVAQAPAATEAEPPCPTCHADPLPPPPIARPQQTAIRETRDAIQETSFGGGGGGGLGISGRDLMFGLGGALLGGFLGYKMGQGGFGFGANQQGYGFNPYAPRYSLPGAYPAPGGFGLNGPFGGGPLGGGLFGRQLPNAYPAPGGAPYGAGTQFGFGFGGGVYGQQPILGVGGGNLYGQPALGGYYGNAMLGSPTIGAGGAPIALPFPGPSAGGGYTPYYQQGVNGGIIYNGAR